METEIESLIVRLIGDGSSFQQMMQESVAASKEAAAQVEQAAKQIEGFSSKMEGFATTATQALAALGTTAMLHQAFEGFAEAEAISLHLTAALESNGRAVEATRAEYERFAAQLEKTTTMEDDAVLALLAKAEAFQLTGEAAKKAVKDSIALAAVNDGEASSYLRFTAAMAKGDTELAMHMARMIPQLRGITDEAEFVAKAQQLIATGMSTAEAEMNSSAGALKVLKRDWGNLLEELGKFVAMAVGPVVKALTSVVAWLKELPDWVKAATVVVAGLAAAAAAIATVAPLVIGAFATMKAAAIAFGTSIATNPVTAWIAAIAAAAVAAYALGRAVYSANRDVQELNRSLEQASRYQQGQVANFDKATRGIVDQIGERSGDDKRSFIQDQIQRAEKEVQGYKNQIAIAKKEVEELDSAWNNATGNKLLEAARRELQEAEEMLRKARERVGELNAELQKTEGSAMAKKLAKDIATVEAALKEQLATFGMSQAEISRYKLALAGATDEQLKNVDALAQQLKVKELTKSMQEQIAALQEQAATFGMTAGAAAVYQMQIKGASDEQIEAAKAIAEQLDALEHQKKVMEKAKELTDKFQSPTEKLAKAQAEIQEMFDAGAISAETYGRAMADAAKGINKAADAQKRASAEFASAEAVARILEYRDRMAFTPRPAATPKPVPVKVAVGENALAGGGVGGRGLIEDLLKKMLEEEKKQNARPVIVFEPAGL